MNWININTDLFHFLRPQWLWLFIPMVVVALMVLFSGSPNSKWKKTISPHLLPYMVEKGNKLAIIAPIIAYIVSVSCMILAIAGPTWEKIEVPGTRSEAILLIAVDLSPSMLVDDVSPNRLERAKFKIQDLLEANPGSKVGLIAYSGTCHPVITPCSDYELVIYQLKSLIPQIMPIQGTNYTHLLSVADTIFSRTEAPSTLLIVTDEINKPQADKIIAFANKSKNNIEILTIATTQGGRIPSFQKGSYFKENGEYVISRLDQTELFRLQENDKINVNPLTMGNEDVKVIAHKIKDNLEYRKDGDLSEEEWKEMGFPLLWITMIILVLWFRKGWMIQGSIILFFFSSCETKVQRWDDLWYTKDYQGQQAMEKEDYKLASSNYESIEHKGTAYYKSGDYESAIELFKLDTSAISMYNLALAYAANGQNEMAAEALSIAEELEPNNNRIKQAKLENEQVRMQMDSLARINPEIAITLQEEEEERGELNERNAQSEDEELSSDTEVDELKKDGDRITDEQETGIRKADEMEFPPEEFQAQKESNAQNILLREISADPSEFLKRRFKYQKKKYYNNEKQPKQLW